jgi:hypothetical protein
MAPKGDLRRDGGDVGDLATAEKELGGEGNEPIGSERLFYFPTGSGPYLSDAVT